MNRRSNLRCRSSREGRIPNLPRRVAHHSKLTQGELTFSDPVHELDAGDCNRSISKSLKPKHWAEAMFDGSMVLFDQIVQVF